MKLMAYEPRFISFLGRDDRIKHYGIATHDRAARRSPTRPVTLLRDDST